MVLEMTSAVAGSIEDVVEHEDLCEAPICVVSPAPQSLHASDPVILLYFPSTHEVQLPPSGPE